MKIKEIKTENISERMELLKEEIKKDTIKFKKVNDLVMEFEENNKSNSYRPSYIVFF